MTRLTFENAAKLPLAWQPVAGGDRAAGDFRRELLDHRQIERLSLNQPEATLDRSLNHTIA